MVTEDLHSLFSLHPVISTDSRNISPDSLFFALKGPRFNGNRYAKQALEAGAAYAIVDEEAYASDTRCILVPDVLNALQNLAWYHRNQFEIPVVGITGSNGKTTTKELLHSVLSQQFRTLATKGNLNNHIGVPLTVLRINRDTELAIIEMGANHLKEIAMLCSIARPSHGLITNIGKAHLEGFGSIEGVMQAKKELYDSLAINNGHAFVLADSERLRSMAADLRQITWYGKESSSDIRGWLQGPSASGGLALAWQKKGAPEKHELHSALNGVYNFDNLLAAVCVGDHFGLSPARIRAGIENYTPGNNRSQELRQGSNHLLLDAYNANPGSMSAALRHLAAQPGPKKLAILGDMLELGAYSQTEHAAILKLLEELAIPNACLIGPEFFRHRKAEAGRRFFENRDQAAAWLKTNPVTDSLVLLKGSRGMELEKLLPFLDS